MPAFIKSVTFDCADALRVARFWAAALGSNVDEEATDERAFVEAPGWAADLVPPPPTSTDRAFPVDGRTKRS